ncbi:MAG: CocE/NonD family hydrolase [Bacteroidota bacterium]|mgnify:CR=1 FL=1
MREAARLAALVLATIVLPHEVAAQSNEELVRASYAKEEHRVPMRDGVRLFTQVYRPRDTSRTYPILFVRTPYSIRPYGPDAYRTSLGPSTLLQQDGYIFVYQDVRGKFMSEGTFEFMRPHRPSKSGPADTDESSDTYDTIEWLIRNVHGHNGRAGMWGISYPGFQVAMGLVDAHPALKAASPQAPMADTFVGDDFHHNGAFWLMHAFGWLWFTAPMFTDSVALTQRPTEETFPTPDGYDFFLNHVGPLSNVDAEFYRGRVPIWNEFMEHGTYDSYWRARNVLPHLGRTAPAVMTVGGWFDSEDKYGAVNIYRTIEQRSPGSRNILVWGPWHHGGWARVDGDTLGHIRFGEKTGLWYRENVERKFFNAHLKNEGADSLPEITAFMTGANEWRSFDAWPPKAATPTPLYLREGGLLSFAAPTQSDGANSYVSDPAKPVPFTAQTTMSMGHLYMVEDQRFAASRPDVLVYQTEPLAEDVTVAGPATVELHASTSGTDCDWIVKLIDVFPPDTPDPKSNPTGVRMGGFQMLVAGEALRAKFRDSFEEPTAVPANRPVKYTWGLADKLHRFRAGHRIMVQIQSTWFPLVDRNTGSFQDLYKASASDYRPTTQRVYHASGRPTRIVLPLLKDQ